MSYRFPLHLLWSGLMFCLGATFFPGQAAAETVQFNRDIRPILSDKCFACHGFDAKERKAGLRLDIGEGGAFADNDGVRAIVPGDIEASEAWHRIISSDEDEIMPPPDAHKKITAEERKTIRQWIEEGAPYQAHWAFETAQKPTVPGSKGHPIDAFIDARLASEKLVANKRAKKEQIIRRVTLDLTGLPPTPAEVDAFLTDQETDAFERLVDGLQSRVAYGEHMARYWLDLARYGDTHGLHLDNERSMWPYRDWVVRAINDNLAFDDFTRWQIAGDLIPDATMDQRVASGFNRCNVTTGEGGSIDSELIFRYAVDRTATTAEVWMGLTAGCAVCHDHKFDPLTTKEFYEMYAFFHSAADPARDGNRIDTPPVLKLFTDEDKARMKKLQGQIKSVEADRQQEIDAILADYKAPSEMDTPPVASTNEVIWFEDAFPEGFRIHESHGKPTLVGEKDDPVFSGKLSLKRAGAEGLVQDVCDNGPGLDVIPDSDVFVYAYLDPEDPPDTIMIQFHTDGWKHRAVWGAEAQIPWGKRDSPEKVLMGKLPEPGKWVRLSLPARRMALDGKKKVTGFAFTQFGGSMWWDKLGLIKVSDPTTDPVVSWAAWQKQDAATRESDLGDPLKQKIKGRGPDEWTEDETKQIKRTWIEKIYAGSRDRLKPIQAYKAGLVKQQTDLDKNTPITMIMADLPKLRKSFVMQRGAYDSPGERVTRGTPAFLPPLGKKSTAEDGSDINRLDLADWLVSGKHPLTSRVTVNRIWQQFFGHGLVGTSNDFGSQSEPPSHPELLDWLAVTFVDEGWDMKQLVKHIVTSEAYQRDATATAAALSADPDNRLLARGPRLRLDAEVLRDQALFVSGLLVDKVGGRGVNPYQPPNIWEPVGFGGSNTRNYKQGSGDDLYRRSLYTFMKRTAPPPFMSTFDAPNREQSCSARGRSNTPMQALQLMNDIQHIEAARNFAQRMLKEGGDSASDRLVWAWRVLSAREPSQKEINVVIKALSAFGTRYRADEAAAKQLIAFGESKADPELAAAELAAYTMAANILMNLDEAINH